MDAMESSLRVEQVLELLRRRASLIVLCFVLAAGVAFAFSRYETKRYTATAALVFNDTQQAEQVAGLQAVGISGSTQPQQQTNIKLVLLGDTAEKTASLLGHGLTAGEIRADLSVGATGESSIVNVAATSTSPAMAAKIANTYVKIFVEEQQNSNRQYYNSALVVVNKQLAALGRQGLSATTLEERAQSLRILAELPPSNVQIAQAASPPTAPSSPKTSRNTVLGGVFGLLLGFGLVFLLERLDRDRLIREPKDLEAIYRLPLLGVVPESTALSRPERLVGGARASLPPGDAEAFHLIRAHLRYLNIDRELRTLLVVSAAPGDGKTTIARHLAAAAGRMGSKVLLLEADLRRSTLAQQLGLSSGPGLADVLLGTVPLSGATQSIDPEVSDQTSRGHIFDVVVAGVDVPSNPGELIESRAMGTLLEQAKSDYDLIVIDTPPLTSVSDAFPLLSKVDGIVIVGWVGRSPRDMAEQLHNILDKSTAPLLGVIANGLQPGGADDSPYFRNDKSSSVFDSTNGASSSDELVSTSNA